MIFLCIFFIFNSDLNKVKYDLTSSISRNYSYPQNDVKFFSDFNDEKTGPAHSINLTYISSESRQRLGGDVVVVFTVVVDAMKQSEGLKARPNVFSKLILWFDMKISCSTSLHEPLTFFPISVMTQEEKISIPLRILWKKGDMKKMLNHQTAIWSSIKKYIQYHLEIHYALWYFQFETNNNISNVTCR